MARKPRAGLPVPHYSTLWCRATGLDIPVPARRSDPVHLVVDSTGLKVCGEGEWKVRQHGLSKRRLWRKLHLGVDQATGMILSRKAVLGKGARPVIPPRPRYSAPQGGCNHATARGQGPAPTRGTIVKRVTEIGSKAWKVEANYHRRSLAETAMYRVKFLIGPTLKSRTLPNQKSEATITVNCLNQFTAPGMPVSVKIG